MTSSNSIDPLSIAFSVDSMLLCLAITVFFVFTFLSMLTFLIEPIFSTTENTYLVYKLA